MNMNSCLYITKHLHMLNDVRKDTFNYVTYQKKPLCKKCSKNKDVVFVTKNVRSKTFKDVANITGNLIVNPACPINARFYCKKCEIYF